MARAVSEIEQEIRALTDIEKERLLRALLEELDAAASYLEESRSGSRGANSWTRRSLVSCLR
jgi:hypothetical protein